MKVIVVGLSPYLLTSRAKLNSLILKHLYISGHEVLGVVWSHDVSFFVPETDESGVQRHYYDFNLHHSSGEVNKHRIPITPFNRGQNEAVIIYEICQAMRPDVIITVGDYNDFLYMKAVKMFDKSITWLFALTNYTSPIAENKQELLDEADGVLCSSEFGRQSISASFKKELIDVRYVGCGPQYKLLDREVLRENMGIEDRFRIMACAKSSQSDNLATLIEVVSNLREDIPEVQLYLHTNIYDNGDYDMHALKERFDPSDDYLVFPEKYVSLLEGVPDADLSIEYNVADLFVSIPMVSATSMSVFESVACGCFPIMSNCGSNRDIASILHNHLGDTICSEDFLVRCTKLMSGDGSYLNICDPEDLKRKILWAYENRKKCKGLRAHLSELNLKYGSFLNRLSEMMLDLDGSTNTICLETV